MVFEKPRSRGFVPAINVQIKRHAYDKGDGMLVDERTGTSPNSDPYRSNSEPFATHRSYLLEPNTENSKMPENFAADLTQDVRTKMVDLLNANLKETIALTLAVKQAHWNLKGRGFIGVHELLDDVADRLRDGADLMAERAAILGGFAEGTIEAVAKDATLEAYPIEESDIEKHIEALKTRFMYVGGKLRDAMDEAADAGDEDTADLFTEVSRGVDKDAWFIGANAAN